MQLTFFIALFVIGKTDSIYCDMYAKIPGGVTEGTVRDGVADCLYNSTTTSSPQSVKQINKP